MKLSTVDTFKHMKFNPENCICLEGTQLRKYQQYLLMIAADIIRVCEEYQITYHLSGGSCLGAVRHQGFIPWDDDMDLDILGDDFDLFAEKFLERFGDKYWLHTCKTHDYGMTVSRVRLKGSVFRAREDLKNEECGFFVDLMRIENVSDHALIRNLHGFLCMASGFLLSCRNFYQNRAFMKELAEQNPEFYRVYRIKVRIGFLTAALSLDTWTRLTQKIYGACHNSSSRYVTVPGGRKHFFGELRKREGFVTSVKASFEGYKWNIPSDYDEYLKSMYGEYMVPPEKTEQEEHILLELQFPEESPVPDIPVPASGSSAGHRMKPASHQTDFIS